jgi:uncharacterized membrane protein
LTTLSGRTVRQLTLTALFTALVTVATVAIQIPLPATQGYINVGDAMIFVTALLMGPRTALIAGGVGSALADILSGFAFYAPWTLVIKGLEGLIAAALGYRAFRTKGIAAWAAPASLVVAALWMVFGYYVAGGVLKGFTVSLADVPANLGQGLASVALAIPVLAALRHVNLRK